MAERGGEVVEKVGRLLRALGAAGGAGANTSTLARETALTRPTAHRLLGSLSEQGLVDRDRESGNWQLGPELYLLGSSAAARYDIVDAARDIVSHLAAETGESAYLSAARGLQTVCLLEEEGSFPLRSHVLHVGIRFPLGVASAGLAILAHLPPEEAEQYVRSCELMPGWGRAHSRTALRSRIRATRQMGYAVNPGLLVEGSWGMAASVFDRRGRPSWALSLTGVQSRFQPSRQPRLGKLLLQQAHMLTQRLSRR